MAWVIWKKRLGRAGEVRLMVPADAKFLSVGIQTDPIHNEEDLCVWIKCDPTLPLVEKSVYVTPTGDFGDHGDNLEFIGTAIGKIFVWHVFTDPS